MAQRAPPPTPEEYKGRAPAPPPPSSVTNRSRPNSQASRVATGPAPPPPPGRGNSERGFVTETRSRPNSQANRPPPPIPNMADIENARNAAPAARPPVSPKAAVEDLDTLSVSGGKKKSIFVRKYIQYKEGFNKCRKSQHAMERALVCFIAVSLLWLTSLSLCQALVNAFIVAPPVDLVIFYGQESLEDTLEYKIRYANCANRLTADCARDIDAELQREIQRVSGLQNSNRRLIDDLYVKRDQCNVELSNGLKTLAFLQQYTTAVDPRVKFNTSITFTDPRCQLVDEMLKGGTGGIQALGVTDRYVSDADKEIATTASAINARASYDQQYLANKTKDLGLIGNTTLKQFWNETSGYFKDLNKTHDLYMACVAPTKTYNGLTCPSDSVLSRAAEIQVKAQAKYNEGKALAEFWQNRANDIVNQANTFYLNLKNNQALQAAIDALLVLQGAGSLDAMGFNRIGDILTGSMGIGNMAQAQFEAMFLQFENQAKAYRDSIVLQQQIALQQQLALLNSQLNFGVNNPLPPYNPPPVNTSNEVNAWQAASGPFVSDMANTLNNTLAAGEENGGTFVGAVNNVSSTPNLSSTILNNLQNRALNFYIYDEISVNDLKNAWESILNTALVFDYLFRVFHTLHLIRKYWRVSAIDVPPADVRTDLMQDKGMAVDNRNAGQKLAAFLAHPATQCLVLSIISLIIFALLVALYLPIYLNYVDGCVKHDQITGNGTMISNNAFTLSVAFSRGEGDRKTTVEVDRLNARRELACDREIDESVQIYTQHEKEWDFVFRSHRDLQYQARTLGDCLDISAAQAFNTTAAAQATNNNITSLLQAVPGASCNATLPQIQSAVFNCLNVKCGGTTLCTTEFVPSIKLQTWRGSCLAEWYLHATFLGSIMVIVAFILLNCSRIITLRGLVRVFWRYLSDGRFSYLGTCERTGDLRYPSIITEQGYSMKRGIRESLAIRLKWWERKSCGILTFGMLLNAFWLGPLIFISNNLGVMNLTDL